MSKNGSARAIDVTLRSSALLHNPVYNKGSAFTYEERDELGLFGLLPPHLDDLETQIQRSYQAISSKNTDIGRHIYLRQLQDTNETLFYALIGRYLTEMLPIVYTPTVGLACQRFSEIYRRPRGLFVAYPRRDVIDKILDNAPQKNVEAIVVTDGERILGLGDQGAGGMGIPIGKLSLYTACGGFDPATTLPMLLDVGTNNEERLADPLYIGWRNERITGQDYDDFVEMFVEAVMKKFPGVLLQWEDFAQKHAAPILERYRDRLLTFNDDIQGTAAVALGTLLAATKASGMKLTDHRVAVLGAGSAGCGIAEQIVQGMVRHGLSETEARGRFYMIDRPGLLHDGMTDLLPIQSRLVQPKDKVAAWASEGDAISLADVVEKAKPTVLIGVSGQPNQFTETIVRQMAKNTERPVIFPLSNPTSRCEAVPADLIAWTDGKALVATGSPFDPIPYGSKSIDIAQSNNVYIFPGLGMGVLASGATRISDEMMMAAAEALAEAAPIMSDPAGSLLPHLQDIQKVSRNISAAVAREAVEQGHAPEPGKGGVEAQIDAKYWTPVYRPYRAV
jgi:malate dehydrogenase (oxaloacetate-decarboxylating)